MNLFGNLPKGSSFLLNPLHKLKLKYFFASSQARMEFSQKLSQGRYYEILGFSREVDFDMLNDNDIKRRYLGMIKKYHSDSVVDPIDKIENEEITKCIISAYNKISQQRIRQQIDKGVYRNIYNDEDEIAMKIYGKNFNEIKYHLFKQENAAERANFMAELQKIRKQSKYYDHVRDKQEQESQIFNFYRQMGGRRPLNIRFADNFRTEMMKIIIPIAGVIGVLLYFYSNRQAEKRKEQLEQRRKQRLTLTQEEVKRIQRKSIQLYEKKLNDLITSFTQQQPPSLKYPTKQDPQQIDQLIQYTIGPDINLYEISPQLMNKQSSLEKLKSIKSLEQLKAQFGTEFDPFPLTKIKVNSAITLSLQAERCLQNIYIKVKDVADEIERTGRYIPPKIFFRFYGYLMFQIRQKPLSLSNYRDTEYVSLFDLFFHYYSPIPLKRHEYNEYVVGLYDEDLKMYGQVHLNHRKIPQRYITNEDKVVVMRDNFTLDGDHKYQQVWHNFYRKYMKIWARGYSDRISTEHQ